jgi:hypothetical protein
MEYKPIRILKDVQVSVRSRADAELHYPHGEVQSIPVRDATVRLPGYTVFYYHPMRINVPTEKEMWFCNTEFAAFIPQHKELGCDDPTSELSGSRSKTREHKRKAGREIQDRQEREPELKKQVEAEAGIETETEPEPEPKLKRKTRIKRSYDKPSEPEKTLKEKSDV